MKRTQRLAAALMGSILLCAQAVGSDTVTANKRLAVTVDDLPFVHIDHFEEQRLSEKFTRLLTALEQAGIEAVGFVNEDKLYRQGELVSARVSLLQQWLDAGMELGNHTYSHLSLNTAGSALFKADILSGERTIRQLMTAQGRELRYFRHPFLHVGRDLQGRREVERFLQAHGYAVAPVTIHSHEWLFGAAYDNALSRDDMETCTRIGQAYIEHMAQAISYAETLAGDMFGRNIPHVLLLHANMLNADYFPALAELIRQRGYGFAQLEEVLRHKAYRTADTYVGWAGDSWLHHWLLTAGVKPRPAPASPDFIRELAGSNGNYGY